MPRAARARCCAGRSTRWTARAAADARTPSPSTTTPSRCLQPRVAATATRVFFVHPRETRRVPPRAGALRPARHATAPIRASCTSDAGGRRVRQRAARRLDRVRAAARRSRSGTRRGRPGPAGASRCSPAPRRATRIRCDRRRTPTARRCRARRAPGSCSASRPRARDADGRPVTPCSASTSSGQLDEAAEPRRELPYEDVEHAGVARSGPAPAADRARAHAVPPRRPRRPAAGGALEPLGRCRRDLAPARAHRLALLDDGAPPAARDAARRPIRRRSWRGRIRPADRRRRRLVDTVRARVPPPRRVADAAAPRRRAGGRAAALLPAPPLRRLRSGNVTVVDVRRRRRPPATSSRPPRRVGNDRRAGNDYRVLQPQPVIDSERQPRRRSPSTRSGWSSRPRSWARRARRLATRRRLRHGLGDRRSEPRTCKARRRPACAAPERCSATRPRASSTTSPHSPRRGAAAVRRRPGPRDPREPTGGRPAGRRSSSRSSYSDGFGREIQKKVRAEAGRPRRARRTCRSDGDIGRANCATARRRRRSGGSAPAGRSSTTRAARSGSTSRSSPPPTAASSTRADRSGVSSVLFYDPLGAGGRDDPPERH